MAAPAPAGACGELGWEAVEAARWALNLWALLHLAVGQAELRALATEHWGGLVAALQPLAPRLRSEQVVPLENGTACAAAVAAARLLVWPWQFVPLLNQWLTPRWLLVALDWAQLVRAGWGALFLVLAQQLPSERDRGASTAAVAIRLPPPDYAGYGPLAWARKVQGAMRRWYESTCPSCQTSEILLPSGFQASGVTSRPRADPEIASKQSRRFFWFIIFGL
ncbi:unnamed protein product [Prorocentrum cordatum]|uniref:Uncharacterized protein n=1 Tax=Prorocentrum cordatum TaxID=2364126 RepID=A0ABN9PTA9_9DINO|nr:unnamed protein product [Polarella glacialis]